MRPISPLPERVRHPVKDAGQITSQLRLVNTVASFIAMASLAGQADTGVTASLNFLKAQRLDSPTKKSTPDPALCMSDSDALMRPGGGLGESCMTMKP